MTRSCARGLLVVLGATGLWLSGHMISLAATGHDGTTMKSAVLLRLGFDASQPDLLQPLKMRVIVSTQRLSDAHAFAHVASAAQAHRVFAFGAKLLIIGAGPVLDQPDELAVQPLERQGNSFVLHVHYTAARGAGIPLRRNVPWLPIVEVALPASLAPGEYQVSAHWQAVESLSSGEPVGAAHRTKTYAFTIGPHDAGANPSR